MKKEIPFCKSICYNTGKDRAHRAVWSDGPAP